MDQKRWILIVDDQIVNRNILSKILDADYNILIAENGQQALDILDEKKEIISAILLDIIMPVLNGYEVLKAIRQDPFLATIPVIVTTSKEDDESEVKALSLGAYDFLTKPFKANIIKHRLANTINLRETAAVVNAAKNDELTGLYNKQFFLHEAKKIIDSNPNNNYDIICLDVEKFKLVNDLFGEQIGDQLLNHIASIIRRAADNQGICSRFNSDTFFVLTIHQDNYQMQTFQDFINQVNEFNLSINIKIRCGIYVINDTKLSINAMCDRAQLAAESIKGKYNQLFSYYDDKIRQKMLDEQAITDSMQIALDEEQFKVYYQPKYNLANNCLAGAEALVRWIHPEKGFMSPGEFIPLFEKNGFIIKLDYYVWEHTCNDIANLISLGITPVAISVNVSRADIYNPNLPEVFLDLIHKYDIPAKYLHLEITETAYIENASQLVQVVSKLKDYGFIIEMDDFGSGYSSLNILSKLPIDILKLDMKFIQNETGKNAINNKKSIISFVISLAKWLNLLVIAEGVETIDQVESLKNMDCDYVQGYYYAKPMPVEQFFALLSSSKTTEMVLINDRDIMEAQKNKVTIEPNLDATMVIVDDIKLNRALLSEIFAPYFTVVEFDNGSSAIEYINANANSIVIVLLDLVMPIMDGFQILKKIKDNHATSDIPVIITSQAGENSEVRAIEIGADDFISKPYYSQVALRRVQNVVAQAKLKKLQTERDTHFNKITSNRLS